MQFLPRSASERAPVEKNTFLLRSATCMMVSDEAEEISPNSSTAPSCSIMRCALVEAVAGLTESSDIRSIWLAHDAAGRVDLFGRHLHAELGVAADRAEKAGQRHQMADLDLARPAR